MKRRADQGAGTRGQPSIIWPRAAKGVIQKPVMKQMRLQQPIFRKVKVSTRTTKKT